MPDHCVTCRYFQRHREVHRGPPGDSDNLIEVDSIWGDCRRWPPTHSWFKGHVFPIVTTGHWCGEYTKDNK